MEQRTGVVFAEVFLDVFSKVDCVERNDQINILFYVTEEEALVQASQLSHLLEIQDFFLIHAITILPIEAVFVVDRINVYRSFGNLILQKVIDHLLAQRCKA